MNGRLLRQSGPRAARWHEAAIARGLLPRWSERRWAAAAGAAQAQTGGEPSPVAVTVDVVIVGAGPAGLRDRAAPQGGTHRPHRVGGRGADADSEEIKDRQAHATNSRMPSSNQWTT